MSTDHSITLRQGGIPILKADPVIAAMVAGRVHSVAPADPVWDFILWGLPVLTPDESSCQVGEVQSVIIHTFTKGAGTVGLNNCGRLNKAVALCLDGRTILLPQDPDTEETATAWDITHTQSQIIRDSAEKDAYHGLVSFEIAVAEGR